MGFVYIALTIALTVYGQLALKWHIAQAGELPPDMGEKIVFLLRQLVYPVVISSFASAFLASLTWMAAMTQFELSFAYPFMSLSFVIAMILSFLLLGETFSWSKVIGTLVVLLGLFILTR